MAKELGASVVAALTIDVTHVVAEGFSSPKYTVSPGCNDDGRVEADFTKYAVEHRIPVMSPTWISDAYDSWIQGEEVNLEEVRTLP